MKHLSLKKKWDQNKSVVNGWCSIPSTITAEIMSLNNFDSLTVDLQPVSYTHLRAHET